MTDLSSTIAPKSDQLNADDLISGPRTITVTRVSADPSSAEQPVNVFFEGDNGKPYKPCKSMRRVMVAVWGSDGSAYPGRSMTLYRDPAVTFGGMQVGGIRISHMTNIDQPMTMALTATRAKRAPFTVQPLQMRNRHADNAAAIEAARAEARRGSDKFREFWNTNQAKEARDVLKPMLAEFQELAKEADEAREKDAFGLPPIEEDSLTPEQRAEMEEAQRAFHEAHKGNEEE